MTAGVVILNRYGVALEEDSAVTVEQGECVINIFHYRYACEQCS